MKQESPPPSAVGSVKELVNENMDFEIDERYDVIVDSNTGKAYNLNIVAEYIERF